MYTSRQLLDPNMIMERQKQSSENIRRGWEALGDLAEYVGDKVEEQNRKKYLLKDRNVDKIEDLPEWQDPQFRAAAYSFMKGDRSGIDNYYQTKALNKAREEETATRNAEIQATNDRYFDLAKRQIESAISPEEKIKAIDNAIQAGIKANKDTSDLENELELVQEEKGKAEFIVKEQKFDEAQEKKNKDIKNRTKDLIEEYVVRLEDIEDKEEYNKALNELKGMAEANGLRSEIKWPDEKKISKKPSVKELNDGIKTGKYTHKQAAKWGFKWNDKLGEYR
jgi:hypothetical protein